MIPVEIESMGPDAWARVRDLRLAALAGDPDAFGSTLERERAFTPEDWIGRLSGVATTFLARHEGRDVGMATGSPWRDEGTGLPSAEKAGLFGMWVSPDARGQRIGDRLVEAVVAWARSAGFVRVVLEVGEANTPAGRLYERHGFRPTGRRGALPPPRAHIREHELELILRDPGVRDSL